MGVTLGSCRYIMYVDQRCLLMGWVQGALREWTAWTAWTAWTGGLMVLLASSGERRVSKWLTCSLVGLETQLSPSDADESWLNREELVCVDRAVDGRLDSHSESLNESSDQSGKRFDGRDKPTPVGAGVFGGEKARARALLCDMSMSSGSAKAWPMLSAMSSSTTKGSSILGMGTSAAATDARNCCVGAVLC
jgi:hypothetical protein